MKIEKINYDELIQEINQEKVITVSNVEDVLEHLIQSQETISDFEDFEDFEYTNSLRKKIRTLANIFSNKDFKVYGTADDFHNCAVTFARENMYDCACIILQRGLEESNVAIDLLADYIRYGISCGRYVDCEEYYNRLKKIPKKQWNWRAFSFSIDYLLDGINHTIDAKKRNGLKRTALKLSDEFISIIGTDQAYFDKAQVVKIFGKDTNETEESILQQGLNSLKVAPKCALRMSDIFFERGDYKEASELIKRCWINAFKTQPDINGSYSFLLSALSKTSRLFVENIDNDFSDSKSIVLDIYKDFNTAFESGLPEMYKGSANTAIKIIAAQTNFDYPYKNIDDPYDL